MIKRLIFFILIVLVLFFAIFFSHQFLLKDSQIRFSLLNIYLFNAVASVIIYLLVELVCKWIPNQTGFAFLATIFSAPDSTYEFINRLV